MRVRWRCVVGCLCLLGFGGTVTVGAQETRGEQPKRVEFGTQVRPLLAERCYECHGPDSQEGGLRLDVRSDAQRGGDSGVVIRAGASATSRLIEVLEATDADERMPLGKKPLTAEQIKLLRRWVDEGAEWPDAWSGDVAAVRQSHWSFRPPLSPPLPSVALTDWPRNAIDRFVLARLEREGLSPSAEADRFTLIRRLYLDLIGLPPSPADADAFVSDPRADAYERLVDHLLASSSYGERWGRRWLDLARYADTNGYEKDRPRSIWPYRDWVVRALNADVPFDRFTIQQLAGDLLPGATVDDQMATGFHRNTMQNEEGGIDPLEFRYLAMIDRVNTTGTTWLGLTVGCAQCHSHKYDPLQQREYYQLLAFLNNCEEPDLVIHDNRTDAERQAIREQIARLTAELPERFPVEPEQDPADPRPLDERRRDLVQQRFAEWEQEQSRQAADWVVLRPASAQSNLPLLTVLEDDSVLASGDQTKSDKYELTFPVQQRGVTAIRLEALPHESLPLNGPGRAYYEGPKGDFFLSEFRASVGDQSLPLATATHDYSQLSIGGGDHGASLTLDGNTTTGWSTSGREGEPHAAVYRLAEPVDLNGVLSVKMIFERHFSCGLGRFRISVTSSDQATAANGHPAELEAVLAKALAERTPAETEQLFARFLQMAPQLEAARKEIAKLRESLPQPVTTLVLKERPVSNVRPTHVHNRGEFLQPKELVEPEVPAFLPPLPSPARRDRLGFARWLVDSSNPLTSRVAVNRQWQAFFGRGLVRTLEDFGIQGELPSHPELLDWLAVEFASGGAQQGVDQERSGAWSLKQLHRLIVTSATYRQSSGVDSERLQRDPENLLLTRGPRVRLEAELIRDSALAAAGLLTAKMGGPGVFPPQPESVTTEGTYGKLPWEASVGEDRYRRSLYTYMKRTAPFAMLATFDAPSGEACVARRESSNSPLQALTLLNDLIFLEAAQALGTGAAVTSGTDRDRAEWLFRRCLTRPLAPSELDALVEFAASQRARFNAGQLDARKFTADGDGNLVERATWTVVARAVMNLDEAITKR